MEDQCGRDNVEDVSEADLADEQRQQVVLPREQVFGSGVEEI
ncbi:hypothetical protein [Sphingomonas sp. BAUL-RG-20F-R05-02]|nr:hypothetical protein [Sphingomonas sp. BAUL-RG-20F-R05-02]